MINFSKKKMKTLWFLIFAILFLLSIDFWAWNKTEPFIFGLPFWVIYILILTLSLSFFYYLFCRYFWRTDLK